MATKTAPNKINRAELFGAIEQHLPPQVPTYLKPAMGFVSQEGDKFIGSLRIMENPTRASIGFFKRTLSRIKHFETVDSKSYRAWLKLATSEAEARASIGRNFTEQDITSLADRGDPAMFAIRALERLVEYNHPDYHRISTLGSLNDPEHLEHQDQDRLFLGYEAALLSIHGGLAIDRSGFDPTHHQPAA